MKTGREDFVVKALFVSLWKDVILCSVLTLATVVVAREPNYDEAKVAAYSLEDPLSFADGRKLASAAEWPLRRREIVKIFEREMYGRTPPAPETLVWEVLEEGPTLAGLAIRRQYRTWFVSDKTGPYVDWLVIIPNRIKQNDPRLKDGRVVCENTERVPVVLLLNYRGNHELVTDPEVIIPDNIWVRNSAEFFCSDHRPSAKGRGLCRGTNVRAPFPLETIVARGYALITACYGQVSPDAEVGKGDWEDMAYTGVFDLWPRRDPAATDNVTALGAWAWALSRGLDLAFRIPEIDARRNVVTGCSRLAKAALLAASRDERFAVCVPCQTGGGGCPLGKRDYGENVSTMTSMFPHWYCRAYAKYADNERSQRFDQHLLIASIAPRAILVEGFNESWFDTKGEYLACVAASPVWRFLGREGLKEARFPSEYDTSCIGACLGYVRRGGAHGISGSDWQWMLDFADRALKE